MVYTYTEIQATLKAICYLIYKCKQQKAAEEYSTCGFLFAFL